MGWNNLWRGFFIIRVSFVIFVIVFFVFYSILNFASKNSDERAEKSMFNYLNEKRAEKGIAKLSYSNTLANLANSNSKINTDDNELKHTQVSRTFNCKVVGGEDTIGTAEVVTVDQGANPIFYQISPELVGKRLIDSWLDSKTGHKEMLLDRSLHYVGFGVDTTLLDVYGTGEFCP